MNEERLPPLPTGDEQEKKKEEERIREVRSYLLDARENYPEPYYMLEYKGVPFSTIGGIQAISGQKKNGKTFVLAQLMAAILGTGTGRVRQYLPGLKVPERTRRWMGHDPCVLYVDTEMEKLNTAKVLRRVHWLCGWDMEVPNSRFNVLWLRGVTDVKDDSGKVKEEAFKKRYRLICSAIDILKPDAVFIDGIRDIIGDFNDNKESAALVGELMALAQERGICIWNALHMNPRPNADDESKMRGHLGTELGNKITDTLVSIKKKDGSGVVTFTVKQQDARGKDMEDWKFEVTDAAGALGIPRIYGEAESASETESDLVIEADDYFRTFNWTSVGATYTELERWLRKKGITSNRRLSSLFNTAREAGIIYQNAKKKYHYKGLEKRLPNDKAEDLPFDKPGGDDAPF